ncbi:MAG: APC family permease [Candidatus Dormibacteria bacterium]
MNPQDPGGPPTTPPSAGGRNTPAAGSGGNLEQRIPQQGSLPGNRYVVIRREDLGSFRRGAHGVLVATERADEPTGGMARASFLLKRMVVGRRLPSSAAESEQLPVRRALPTLASDALSSVAYGPEAGLSVLALAGVGAFAFEMPIAIAIAVLMVLVVLSYRQLVLARQADGGSYAVARDYLGRWPAMVAAAALLIDYILTVSVSVSSGADALASAFPAITDLRLPLAVVLALLLCAGNLRGVREAGALFSTPTYIFVGTMVALIVVGLIRSLTGAVHHAIGVYPPIPHPAEALTPFLILTAFASGCSSMTGIEAVSNSVRSFRQPQGRNAARTLTLLGAVLVILFLGVTLLDVIYGVGPRPSGSPTVLAQIAADVFSGPGRFFFYVIQFATMVVLILAANASFNGFPRLCAFLARDDHLPHRFGAYGDRLVYSAAILVLTAVAVAVILLFAASTDRLINLYAIGVFTAFTLAQGALVRYGWRTRGPHWRRNAFINGLGAAATLLVDVIVLVVKFRLGAWVVLIIVPILVWYFWSVSRHYQRIRGELQRLSPSARPLRTYRTVVPVRELDSPTEKALLYATTLGSDVVALNLAADPAVGDGIREILARAASDPDRRPRVRTQVVDRPDRKGLRALLKLLDELRAQAPDQLVTVMVPEYVTSAGNLDLLRRPGSLRLKFALLRQHRVVAASFPSAWHDDRETGPAPAARRRVALVPVSGLDVLTLRGLSYARSIADEVIAIHVATGQPLEQPVAAMGPEGVRRDDVGTEPDQEAKALVNSWDGWVDRYLSSDPELPRPQLVILLSPFRTVVQPVLRYLQGYREKERDAVCTIVFTELVTRHWWNQLLHNHRAFHIKSALLGRSDFAVADVTYDLGEG